MTVLLVRQVVDARGAAGAEIRAEEGGSYERSQDRWQCARGIDHPGVERCVVRHVGLSLSFSCVSRIYAFATIMFALRRWQNSST
jgi:hypothetical protein